MTFFNNCNDGSFDRYERNQKSEKKTNGIGKEDGTMNISNEKKDASESAKAERPKRKTRRLTDEQRALVVEHLDWSDKLSARFYYRYSHASMRFETELDELQSAGFLALCQAALTYCPERGVPFTTYAYTAVAHECAHAIRENRPWRLSGGVLCDMRKMREFMDLFYKCNGDDASVVEVAKGAGLSETRTATIMTYMTPPVDATEDASFDDEGNCIGVPLASNILGPDESIMQDEYWLDVQRFGGVYRDNVDKILTPLEKDVFETKCLGDSTGGKGVIKALAAKHGICEGTVKNVYERSLRKLRSWFDVHGIRFSAV